MTFRTYAANSIFEGAHENAPFCSHARTRIIYRRVLQASELVKMLQREEHFVAVNF
jgi:hypothetical protein